MTYFKFNNNIIKLNGIVLFSILILARCDGQCSFGDRSPKDLSRIDQLQGNRYSCEDTVKTADGNTQTYVYNIGICVSADQQPEGATTDAGAIQREKDKTPPTATVMGKISSAAFREGDDWIMLEYYGGKNYSHHCGQSPRSTVIMIMCAPGVKGDLKMIEESTDNSDARNCFYLFELKTEHGCSTSTSGRKLSVGSILVIVFLSLVAVYLLFGLLFQRFVKGAQGLEQIPNYSFWREAGNLVADGCDLVFRSHSASESRQYRGVSGDSMEHDSTRDTGSADDHLLNM